MTAPTNGARRAKRGQIVLSKGYPLHLSRDSPGSDPSAPTIRWSLASRGRDRRDATVKRLAHLLGFALVVGAVSAAPIAARSRVADGSAISTADEVIADLEGKPIPTSQIPR